MFNDGERNLESVIEEARSKDHQLETPCFMMMLGSFENAMLVYKDVRLVWQARTIMAPIFVDVGSFEGKQGLIVTLSDNGFLQVSFLGTEQLTTNAQALALKNQRKIDYE